MRRFGAAMKQAGVSAEAAKLAERFRSRCAMKGGCQDSRDLEKCAWCECADEVETALREIVKTYDDPDMNEQIFSKYIHNLLATAPPDPTRLVGTRKPTPEEIAYGLTLEPLAKKVLATTPPEQAALKSTLPVGVSVLITNGELVLLGERINNTASGLLSTPGGRVEQNEDIFACAVRETEEETGLSLTRDLLKVIAWREHFRFGQHYIMFYVHAPQSFGTIVNKEPDKCKAWGWRTISQIKAEETTEPLDILSLLKQPQPASAGALEMSDSDILIWYEQLEEATTNTGKPEEGIIAHVRDLLAKQHALEKLAFKSEMLYQEIKRQESIRQNSDAVDGATIKKEKLAAHDQKVREEATLAEHQSHVDFESELYATLVDPVAEGSIKEAEMRKQLLEQARWYRQRVYDLESANQKVRAEVREATLREVKKIYDDGAVSATVYNWLRSQLGLSVSTPGTMGKE